MIQSEKIVEKIMNFLGLFMCKTLVKRIVSMLLISLEVPNEKVTGLTGLCNKSVRTLKKAMKNGEIESQFNVSGGGRKRKLADVESAVAEEIEKNDYHTKQQIVDMIGEKYGIKVSVDTVRKLLKKTELSV
jgi:transposase